MLLKEFRVVMPLTNDEYHIGQLFAVADMSKENTAGGEGVEVLVNEPYSDDKGKGQYTHKIYRLDSKVPQFIRMLLPAGALEIHEKAWNGFPYCRTVLTNGYMKENFHITVTSIHKEDRGDSANVHSLPSDKLATREVQMLDITKDNINDDYNIDEDPRIFLSEKTGRGQLGPKWIETANPVMTCYKLVECEFKWMGIQTRVEQFIMKTEAKLLAQFNRKVFCWIDKWFDMDMEAIRKYEDQTKTELESKIKQPDGLHGVTPPSVPPTPPPGAP